MEPHHVKLLRDKKADFPEAANAGVKALRQVFKWAVDAGRADHNPVRDVPCLRPNNPEGFHTWTVEEVYRFEARHPIGTKARLALALFLYTGVRRCDEANLHHCSAHGLRKAGATIAANNGATAWQLKAIFGWETLKQAEAYTRKADQIRLADEAMHLLMPQDSEQYDNKSFPLSERLPKVGKIGPLND